METETVTSKTVRDRTKITWHNQSGKAPKRLNIFQAECQVNVFPFTLMGNT
jgi:hypothetical protein